MGHRQEFLLGSVILRASSVYTTGLDAHALLLQVSTEYPPFTSVQATTHFCVWARGMIIWTYWTSINEQKWSYFRILFFLFLLVLIFLYPTYTHKENLFRCGTIKNGFLGLVIVCCQLTSMSVHVWGSISTHSDHSDSISSSLFTLDLLIILTP